MALSDRIVVMNRGAVAQVGTPESVYQYPADKFVADFVGMPPMNIIPVTCRPRDRDVECVTGAGRLAASLRTEVPVTAAEGHLGIRPGHVSWTQRPADGGTGGDRWLPATISQVDSMGEDTLIYALVDGEAVTILERGPCSVRAGEDILVAFPSAKVHLFVDEKRTPLDRDAAGTKTLAAAPAGDTSK
jgi:ABC-type sugar transport system ATPase subunit